LRYQSALSVRVVPPREPICIQVLDTESSSCYNGFMKDATHTNLKSLVRACYTTDGLPPARYSLMMRLARKVGGRTGRTANQVISSYIATYSKEWS